MAKIRTIIKRLTHFASSWESIDKVDWMPRLQNSEVFRDIPEDALAEMFAHMEPVKVVAGECVIRQGAEGDCFYLIADGSARVLRTVDGAAEAEEIALLEKGAGFGEEALISNAKRNATVKMSTDGILLRLPKEDFNDLLKQPRLDWVSRVQAQKIVSSGGRWLDVRSPDEFRHFTLPNAISAPLGGLRGRLAELDKGISYVCFCRNSRQSATAAFLLRQSGFKAFVLRGGLQRLPGFQS